MKKLILTVAVVGCTPFALGDLYTSTFPSHGSGPTFYSAAKSADRSLDAGVNRASWHLGDAGLAGAFQNQRPGALYSPSHHASLVSWSQHAGGSFLPPMTPGLRDTAGGLVVIPEPVGDPRQDPVPTDNPLHPVPVPAPESTLLAAIGLAAATLVRRR